jgi:hypothetical protein
MVHGQHNVLGNIGPVQPDSRRQNGVEQHLGQ